MPKYLKVAEDYELEEGEILYVEAEEIPIALVRTGEEVFAVHNECPHRAGPLCEGELEEGKLRCPWHGALIDPKTGAASGPATHPARCFPTRIKDGEIQICLS